tara:strand:- start:2099 stop:2707 length:609 start_codon:yes stop_codon:yes gene_type:complete
MSIKKVHDNQPEKFEFTKENLELATNILKKYPEKRKKSAVMPLLYLAQNQNDNWIPLAALKYIGNFLSMPYINVYEIATFYTMYNLAPVGKYYIQVCTTSPCLLRGANEIVKICQNKISKRKDTLSKNGMCSWTEVECLGACVNAPMIQVNKDYYEDLNKDNIEKILESLMEGKPLKPGSYRGRKSSAPENLQKSRNGTNNA